MKRMLWYTRQVAYALPTLLLLGTLALMVLAWGDGDGPVLAWMFIMAPALALLTGFTLRPAQVWIAPVVASLLIATWVIVASLAFDYNGGRPLAMQYVWTLLFFGLPSTLMTWLGTVIRATVEPWWKDRQQTRHGPHLPAR